MIEVEWSNDKILKVMEEESVGWISGGGRGASQTGAIPRGVVRAVVPRRVTEYRLVPDGCLSDESSQSIRWQACLDAAVDPKRIPREAYVRAGRCWGAIL